MDNLNTKLMLALAKNESVDEIFRNELENALNKLLETELTAFLDYEKYDPVGYNSGDSRNGSYCRIVHSDYGDLHIKIPRDRNGEFKQHTIAPYKRNTDSLETTIIQLYKKGITTREIADIIEKMYGSFYTPQTISNITKVVEGQVKAFHNRKIQSKYVVIYCDATYLNVRRDTVAKEALHIILGITPDGNKEVIDYALYPTESSNNYKEMLKNLKKRGLKEVLLFVTDGLVGLNEACTDIFPNSKYQSCWVHVCRNVMKYIRANDKANIMNELKEVYTLKTKQEAENMLLKFINKHDKYYPKATKILKNQTNLFTFYEFPKTIRRSIYTTNLIENLNKNLKRGTKRKEQFPNEESLERYVCSFYCDYNKTHSQRVHLGFNKCRSELEIMFKT